MAVMFLPFRIMGAMLPGLGQIISLQYAVQNLLTSLFAFFVRLFGQFFSLILSLFLSRRREFMADAGAVELTKNPDALISAFRKGSRAL